jgi:hypothetical protein
MKSVNDPPDPKTDGPNPVPRFIYDDLLQKLDRIKLILKQRKVMAESKIKAIREIVEEEQTP